jgi:CBS domain-containing protein
MLVKQILNTKGSNSIVTAMPETKVTNIAIILTSQKIGLVVISSDKETVEGIVSERDIVRAIAERGISSLSLTAADIMTRKIITCSRDATADQILSVMSKRRFRHIPVLENNKLVGLITQGDVVKAKLSQLSMENVALENMIMGY